MKKSTSKIYKKTKMKTNLFFSPRKTEEIPLFSHQLERIPYLAVHPPSTLRHAPVTLAASSWHRKRTIAATSSTLTNFFVGWSTSRTSSMTLSTGMPAGPRLVRDLFFYQVGVHVPRADGVDRHAGARRLQGCRLSKAGDAVLCGVVPVFFIWFFFAEFFVL